MLGSAGVILALAVGLWFGGHPSWLPAPLRSAFTSESSQDKLVNQVLGLLSKEYYRKVDTNTLVNKGLSQIVASLHDPYSHYYSPKQYSSFQQLTDPHLSGIGVNIHGTRKGVRILQVFDGTPAANAGLAHGEQIVAVGSESLAGPHPKVNADRAAHLIKGPAGTNVTITVLRGRRTFTKTLTRADVIVPVADSRLLTYHGTKVGYVALAQFSPGSAQEVRQQVQKMLHQGAQTLILDLRDNGGGLVEEAVRTASIFIPSGTIVSTRGRAVAPQVYLATGNAISTSIPMVVLVNRDTASAAEIVTGALKDHARATVVGTRTYGKGVFQQIERLRNGGALDFTVGEYFTPNGTNLGAPSVSEGRSVSRGRGIRPQVYVAEPANSNVDKQLQVAEKTVVAKLH
ncbi:MAG TPA: S41 family peptidase [Solirubrobacteraceae bacterium]|nr:S41 family peptidase [Solirubrobacteraceae bacterium]